MTRSLTVLGLVLAAAAAFIAFSTSPAGAVSEETLQAYYMAEIEEDETAKVDGEQIGTNTITVGSLPALTCSSVKYTGEALSEGPLSTEARLSPAFETCHVIAPLLGTRTVTVTMNGCTFKVEATSTVTESEQEHFLGDLDIECSGGNKIEVHVYNTSSANDTGASMLCTYDIEPQADLTGITVTNQNNEPTSANDVVADFNVASIDVVRTAGSEAFCGPVNQTAVYKGEATLRATSEESEFVSVQQVRRKFFLFNGGDKVLSVKGEGGKAKITTEKGAIECESVSYEGTPSAGMRPNELHIFPEYNTCSFDGLIADVNFENCKYVHKLYEGFLKTPKKTRHTTGPLQITCGAGESIKFKVTKKGTSETECTFTVGAQSIAEMVKFKNKAAAKDYVVFTNEITGLVYRVEGNEATCGKNNVDLSGTLDGEIQMNGYSEGNQIHFEVFGTKADTKCPKDK